MRRPWHAPKRHDANMRNMSSTSPHPPYTTAFRSSTIGSSANGSLSTNTSHCSSKLSASGPIASRAAKVRPRSGPNPYSLNPGNRRLMQYSEAAWLYPRDAKCIPDCRRAAAASLLAARRGHCLRADLLNAVDVMVWTRSTSANIGSLPA